MPQFWSMRRHPGNYLSACNSNEPHSLLNLMWSKAAQWLLWKCKSLGKFNLAFKKIKHQFVQSCSTLQSSIAEPCSFRWQLAGQLTDSAEVSVTGAAPLTNFLTMPSWIFSLFLVNCCFCSQTSVLRVPHRTCVLSLPWCPESPLSNSLQPTSPFCVKSKFLTPN